MVFNCHNSLDIYGSWDELKQFYIENSTENCILNLNFKYEIRDWEKNILNEKLEEIYYIFLCENSPPFEWLKNIAEKYSNLEFNLVYENRDLEKTGEIIYKYGQLYHKYENIENDYNILLP